MKISEAKFYSLLKSDSGCSELSIYKEYSLNPECVVPITSKENERCEVSDHSSSVSKAMSWNTDVQQKTVLANIETHENSSFIQPCSVSIPRIDLEKYVYQRDTVDFNENISDPLNSSSCSSFDTRTDMDGMKLEMIERYLDNCATNFAVENENQVSFLYDKESSEISENRKPFDLDSEEDCRPFSFTKQNNVDNSSAIERNSNACFTSVSSESDYLNTPDTLNISTKNRIFREHFKNPSKYYSLKQCSVVVNKMNVDGCLISECLNRGKKALISDNSNCIEHDNLSSIQTGNSFDDTKNANIKGGYKKFQNNNCFSECHSEISSFSIKGKAFSCSSKPSNVIDFDSLQNEHEKEIYSENSESEGNRDALFVNSARRKQIEMSKMVLKKKCHTKNIKNGDNSFSLCEISESEQRRQNHTKGDKTTNQKQRMRISSSKKYRNFSQRKHNKILEFEKDILSAKQSAFITETKLRFNDVHVPSDGTHLEKQNILKHKEKTDMIILSNTHAKGNKLSLESNKTTEYQEYEPYFRKYESEGMIKINCIRKETKDKFIPNNSKKVLNFTSNLISKNVRNDKIRFNKTGFNLYSGSTVLGNKKINNYALDNAKISISYENDKELQIMENKYGLKPCSVPLLKLPLSLYTMQVSEYQDNFSSCCKANGEKNKNNMHYLKTKIKTNNAKSNYEFKRKQMRKKHTLPVGARKKCNMFVSTKGCFKLKPEVLRKSTEVIESCSESDVDITECNKNGSECKAEIGYPRYKKKLQISAPESGKFKKNAECSILKSRKKQNRRNLDKKKYEPVMQEAPFRFQLRKRGFRGDIEIIEISETSECDSDVKECHYDKTSENISDISDCDNDIKKCQSDKILGRKVYGKESRKFNEEKVSQKQTCNKYRIHTFPLSKDEKLKIRKSFLEKKERCDVKNGKLKKKTSAKGVCFNSLKANQSKELKQNCTPRCNAILTEVRGDDNVHEINSFMSAKCEGNDNKEIVQNDIVKFNKISSKVCGEDKVHEISSDSFMVVECDSDKYNKHVSLEELDEKYVSSLLKRYSIKPCVVVLEKMKLEECQNNFEDKHKSKTEKKVMKSLKSNINNTNQLSIFKKAHSTCNTSLATVEDKKRMSHKDMIDKENKNMLKLGIYSSNCKPGGEDMKCHSKHVIKTNISKLFSNKLKPSQRRVKYNNKASGESRKCQSEYAETNYKNKFKKALPFVKTICEEKETMNIANTGEDLSKNDMIDNIEQYKAGREIKQGLEYREEPLLEVGLNKDISTRTNCNPNKINNCDSSMKNWERCKKYQFKSECNETYHENKKNCKKTLMCNESICEDLKEQNLNTRGELRKNGMAISDNVNLFTLEEKTGKCSAHLESSVLDRRDGRETISVDAKCKSRTNDIEYNSSSDILRNVKERVKENHFKNEYDKNQYERGYRKTFVPVHMNQSKTAHNKSLKTNIKKTEESESTSLSDAKPGPFQTKYKRLRITSSVQNTKKSRTCSMNNFMAEYHKPFNSFEMEELKPHSLFFSRDCDSVLETSARNNIIKRNSSRMNKTLFVHDKNMPVNFDKQTVRGNIQGNVDNHFRSKHENNRIIDYNTYKTKADNSALLSPPENDYHEVLCRREKFTCFQCGKYVHSAKGLFYHTCPGKRAIGYLCYFCERIYLSLKELERHKRIHKR
ncbi:uncharacterized protein LOC118195822 [Stegodyphus dumicola]|uniref:uncharacterized protein LOC118195822 n=1 Tax=Stegodyphus dumicola TaxID=202533 RepID=UPI0015B00D05|nr:uncharacterized protein LOC118195822 [Stegodyphus dumicola]